MKKIAPSEKIRNEIREISGERIPRLTPVAECRTIRTLRKGRIWNLLLINDQFGREEGDRVSSASHRAAAVL